MQLTLTQDEIEVAVQDYVRTIINVAPNQDITMDFVNGRGPAGLSATLNIVPAATNKSSKTRAAVSKPRGLTPEMDAGINETTESTAEPERAISSTPEDRVEPEAVDDDTDMPDPENVEPIAYADEETSAPAPAGSIFSRKAS